MVVACSNIHAMQDDVDDDSVDARCTRLSGLSRKEKPANDVRRCMWSLTYCTLAATLIVVLHLLQIRALTQISILMQNKVMVMLTTG